MQSCFLGQAALVLHVNYSAYIQVSTSPLDLSLQIVLFADQASHRHSPRYQYLAWERSVVAGLEGEIVD